MRTPALAIAVLALGSALIGCAGSGGGGDGGGGKPQGPCQPPAQATVSYANNIQHVWDVSCAVPGCHIGSVPPGGLDLTPGVSYGQLVNASSTQRRTLLRIKPGDTDNSYVVLKIKGVRGRISGASMPQGCPGFTPPGAQCLGADDLPAIVQWITECAQNN